jgi:hypothetical protein
MSKRSLQTRFLSVHLNEDQLEIRNQQLYDNMRKAMTSKSKISQGTNQIELIETPRITKPISILKSGIISQGIEIINKCFIVQIMLV